MMLDHRLNRRDFMILSGSAAALLIATSHLGCGTRTPRQAELAPGWGFELQAECNCPGCLRRRFAGPWQLPAEDGPFWPHLRHDLECRNEFHQHG